MTVQWVKLSWKAFHLTLSRPKRWK